MDKEKRFKTLIATLGLSATITLLGGCGENDTSKKIEIGNDLNNSKITYEENTLSGTISYNHLEKGYIRIVTLSFDGKVLEPKLMGVHLDKYRPMRGGGGYDTLHYIDLETSMTLLSYFYPNYYNEEDEPEVLIGENFEIVEEISLFDYIVEYNWLQDEYEINELLEFYNEKVKPNLKTEDANDLTLMLKFRQNI